MPARIIAVINQKGGIAKTFTVHNMGFALTQKGYRVLLVDMDYQTTLSFVTGALGEEGASADIWSVLTEGKFLKSAIVSIDGLLLFHIVKGSEFLARADMTFHGDGEKLIRVLETVRDSYDFIIIDTPPGLGICSLNALVASDGVLIPITPETPAVMGAYALSRTIDELRGMGYLINVDGVLVVKYNPRLKFTAAMDPVIDSLVSDLGTRRFRTVIRNAPAAAAESQGYQKTVFAGRKSVLAVDYESFTDEYLKEVCGYGIS